MLLALELPQPLRVKVTNTVKINARINTSDRVAQGSPKTPPAHLTVQSELSLNFRNVIKHLSQLTQRIKRTFA